MQTVDADLDDMLAARRTSIVLRCIGPGKWRIAHNAQPLRGKGRFNFFDNARRRRRAEPVTQHNLWSRTQAVG